jgi:hypothetical protein
MSGANLVFLFLRVLHVLLAAAWLGSVAFVVLFLFPVIRESGSSNTPAMRLMARRIPVAMGAIGGIVVLTGFWLYWRFTGGFDPALAGSMGARVYGTGGLAGLIALIIGGAVVSRAGKKMSALAERAASLSEGSDRSRLTAEINATRDRAWTFAKIVLVLQIIALGCMAIGHYV